jgi:hypothetical protein
VVEVTSVDPQVALCVVKFHMYQVQVILEAPQTILQYMEFVECGQELAGILDIVVIIYIHQFMDLNQLHSVAGVGLHLQLVAEEFLVLVVLICKYPVQVEHHLCLKQLTMDCVGIWEEWEWYVSAISNLIFNLLCIYFCYQLIIQDLVSFMKK